MPSNKLQPALYGGLLLGVLSGLPFIGLGNCCCCLWVLGGGAMAAYILQANQLEPISPGDGATQGLLAGLIGFVVWQVLSLATLTVTAPIRARMFSYMLRSGDFPPEVQQALERANTGEVTILGLVANAFLVLIVSAVFSTLGGLIGVALFRKKTPPVPDVPPLPPGYEGPSA